MTRDEAIKEIEEYIAEAKSEVNTPAELYEYCLSNGAENWKIVIMTKTEVDKERGLWLVSDRKEVLIVI